MSTPKRITLLLLVLGMSVFLFLKREESQKIQEKISNTLPQTSNRYRKLLYQISHNSTRFSGKKHMQIIAHRGDSGHWPENTLAAFQSAIQKGATILETDLVFTKDNILLLRHENELSKTTDIASLYPQRRTQKKILSWDKHSLYTLWKGWFSEDFTWKELQKVRCKSHFPFRKAPFKRQFPLLSLEEFLQWLVQQNKTRKQPILALLEIKNAATYAKQGRSMSSSLLALLERLKLNHPQAPLLIQSFEMEVLKELRKQTKIRLFQLLYHPSHYFSDQKAKGRLVPFEQMIETKGLLEIKTYADGIAISKDLAFSSMRKRSPKQETLFEEAHKMGLQVFVYTFRNEPFFRMHQMARHPFSEYNLFFRLGVDGVISDFPQTALDAWKSFVTPQKNTSLPSYR